MMFIGIPIMIVVTLLFFVIRLALFQRFRRRPPTR
jgi:hypothetical protein